MAKKKLNPAADKPTPREAVAEFSGILDSKDVKKGVDAANELSKKAKEESKVKKIVNKQEPTRIYHSGSYTRITIRPNE